MYPETRLRRLRQSKAIRDLACETRLSPENLILPMFFDENLSRPKKTDSMPDVPTWALKDYEKIANGIEEGGVSSVLVFGVPKKKDAMGSQAYAEDGVVQKAIRGLKDCSDLLVIADLCMCEYTDHGHCGILRNGAVDNDETIELYGRIAVSQARAGADIIAPSGMMDGQISMIRTALDDAGFKDMPIMAYSAKYQSAYYGPFRDIAKSAPGKGNRAGYQMAPANRREAMREIEADIGEGADIIMVKPAGPYLDIIREAADMFPYPLCAYQVSGEYAMIKAAARSGWIDEDRIMAESLLGIKRAGANMIITYYADKMARKLRERMRRTNSGKEYEKLKKLTPGGVSSPVRAFAPSPVVMDSGKGCMITDIDGNEYIDLCMAYGPLIVGHACSRVEKAVRDQTKKGSVFGAPSVPETKLLEKIAGTLPSAEMVRLANSGTEATMHCIRLARGYTERKGIVKMDGGFHGAHNTVLVAAGSGSVNGLPSSKGVPEEDVRNTYLVEYNDADSFERLLDKNEDVAAVIMEPVLGNVGVVPPEKGYLEEMRKIAKSHGSLLIFDEVITGYRLGRAGAQGRYGVTPDLTALGKIIGGGYPAGAFAGRRKIMESIAPTGPVYAAGTFAGNPISAAAGLETIEIMEAKNRYEHLERRTHDLVSRMRDALDDSPVEGCIQSVGSEFAVYFGAGSVRNGAEARRADTAVFGKMFNYMLDHGVYMAPGPMEVSFVSAAHSEETCGRIARAFEGFLKKVKE